MKQKKELQDKLEELEAQLIMFISQILMADMPTPNDRKEEHQT